MKTATYKWKYYNIEYSIVNISELEGELRLDAEYYDAKYIKTDELIRVKDFKYLWNKEISNYITSWKTPKSYDNDWKFLIVRSWDLTGNIINKNILLKTNDTNIKKIKKYDILISSIGRGSIGKVAINLENIELFGVSEVTILNPTNTEMAGYIAIFLQTKYWQKQIERQITGATGQLHLLPRNVSLIKIPIPSEYFQQIIKKLVIEAYNQRENSEQLYKQAEEILLEELCFKNWKPKTKKIKIWWKEFEEEENISIRMLSEVIKADRLDAEYWEPKYDEIEEIIKKYRNKYNFLPKVIDISKDKIKVNKEEIYNYIELADIDWNLWIIKQTKQIKWKDLPSRARMKVEQWNVIMSSVEGSLDKIALINFDKENLVASTGFFVFKEKEINKETLLVLLKVLAKKYIIREAQGTILTAIPYNSLNRILLPKVRWEIQQKISQLIQQSFNSLENSKKLLEIAKKAVEIYIEKDENEWIKYASQEIEKLGIDFSLNYKK